MTDKKKKLQLQLEHERKLEKRQQRCRDQRVFDLFDSPPKLITPSQIQSSSKPLSVLEVANKFTILGSVPKPSYQTTLVTAFDPFASSLQKTAFRHFDRPSPYHNKTPLNLFMIEPNSSHIKSPAALARKYFSPEWHYHAIHPLKTLRYYFDILLFTKSVRITPIYDDPNTKKKLLYHHFYVVRFISEDKWELPPYSSKELPKHDIPFSYHDYIDAWYKVFLYQFEDFSHSWFVQFDKYFKGSFPTWVLSWWQVHGPVHDIMPNEVKDAVRYFSTVYKIEGHQSLFPSSLHFFSFFRVPWILKWQYTFVDNCVARQFSVKWWDKYVFTKVQERLYSEFSGESQTQASPEALTQPEQVSQIQQAPKAPKKSSPSSSSSKGKKSSSSKEKKQSSNKKISKKDLLAVVQAILSQASEASDDEELHREAEIWMKHYSSKQKILLVGEGDLSFSLCLAKAFGSARNMVATSFNTEEDLASMYKYGMRNVRELEEKGCLVFYKVDALQMSEDSFLKTQMFDRIVYNFPHAGFHGFFESDNRQIKLNKTLVEGFFKNAKVLLRKQGGEIHVTHKKGGPYDKWDLVKNAEKIGLVLHEEVPFGRDDYPGYNIKRGHGKDSDLSFEIGDCSTYKFRHPPQFANWDGY